MTEILPVKKMMQYQHGKGQLVNLLRASVEESIDEGVRQVAAISFKNAVKKGWDYRDENGGTNTALLI